MEPELDAEHSPSPLFDPKLVYQTLPEVYIVSGYLMMPASVSEVSSTDATTSLIPPASARGPRLIEFRHSMSRLRLSRTEGLWRKKGNQHSTTVDRRTQGAEVAEIATIACFSLSSSALLRSS